MSDPAIELQVILNHALLGCHSRQDIQDLVEEITALWTKSGRPTREQIEQEILRHTLEYKGTVPLFLSKSILNLYPATQPCGRPRREQIERIYNNYYLKEIDKINAILALYPAPQRKVGREEIERTVRKCPLFNIPSLTEIALVDDLLALLNGEEKKWCPHIAWYPDKGGWWRYAEDKVIVDETVNFCYKCGVKKPA